MSGSTGACDLGDIRFRYRPDHPLLAPMKDHGVCIDGGSELDRWTGSMEDCFSAQTR